MVSERVRRGREPAGNAVRKPEPVRGRSREAWCFGERVAATSLPYPTALGYSPRFRSESCVNCQLADRQP